MVGVSCEIAIIECFIIFEFLSDEVRKSMDTMSLRTSLKTNTKSSKSRGRALTDDILPFHPQEFFTTAPHITIPRSNNSSRKAKSSERRLSFSAMGIHF